MKILAIRGSNLTSLAGNFAVELAAAPLANAGVFAIVGPTGAGKSTLLDAMCLALFDRVPRMGARSSIAIGHEELGENDVRALLRRGVTNGFAEVDFVGCDRRTYRARWQVRRARDRADGTLQAQEVTLVDLQTNQTIGSRRKETLDAIRERLGLSFEQFRRSVLLAQGDFSAFLRADAKERGELLERMTGTQLYSQLSKLIHGEHQQKQRGIDDLTAAMGAVAPMTDDERQHLQAKLDLQQSQVESLRATVAAQNAVVADVKLRDQLQAEAGAAQLQADAAHAAQVAAHDQRLRLARLREVSALREKWARKNLLTTTLATLSRELDALDASIATQRAQRAALDAAQQPVRESQTQLADLLATLPLTATSDSSTAHGDRQATASWSHELLAATAPSLAAQTTQLLTNLQPQQAYVAALSQLGSMIAACDRLVALRDARQRLQTQLAAQQTEATRLQAVARDAQELSLQAKQRLAAADKHAASFDRKKLGSPEAAHRLQKQAHDRLAAISELAKLATAASSNTQAYKNEIANHERLQTQLATQRRGLDQAQLAVAASEAAFEQANAAAQALQVTQSLDEHRRHLVDGEPCPLCGATSHPLSALAQLQSAYQNQAKQANTCKAALDRARIALGQSQLALNTSQTQLAASEAALGKLASNQQAQLQQWQQAFAGLGMLPLYPNPDDTEASAWLASQLAEAQAAVVSATSSREKADKLLAEAQLALGAVQAQRALVDEQARVLQHSEQQLALAQAAAISLGKQLASMQADEASALASAGNLLAAIAPATGRQPDELTIEAQLSAAITGMKSVRESVQQAVQCANRLDQWQQGYQRVAAASSNQLASDSATRQVLHDQQRAALDEHAQLVAELAPLALDDLLAVPSEEIEQLASRLDELAARDAAAQSLATERHRMLKAHVVTMAQPAAVLADALETAIRNQAALEVNEAQLHELQAQRKVDELTTGRQQQLRQKLDQAIAANTTLAQLASVIGSSDGQAFRGFAQGLTLDGLLLAANQHLQALAPRYSLARVPKQNLDLQLIDHDMADEIRAVATLSGGETFLVSLALALGLSSLASDSVRIQSLFIDEGFGTLDAAALDTALAALDTLQASGRQVGIISHMPAVAERVGAAVTVRPTGRGRSQVLVV